jgi:arylsulfatase A-like enzyme
MHEPSIRVPLLLKLPKAMEKAYRPAGTKLDPMVLNVDIAPTVLQLAGGQPPKEMQGRSVVPFARIPPPGALPPDMKPREAWYYEYFEFPDVSHNVNKHRGIRTTKWKLIHYYAPPFNFGQEWELYDLEKDPEERVNLANRPAMQATVKELREKLDALRKELGSKDEK